MTPKPVTVATRVVTAEAMRRAAVDLVNYAEARVARDLGAPPAVYRWRAQMLDRDEEGRLVRIAWTPGTPVPFRAHLLICEGTA